MEKKKEGNIKRLNFHTEGTDQLPRVRTQIYCQDTSIIESQHKINSDNLSILIMSCRTDQD